MDELSGQIEVESTRQSRGSSASVNNAEGLEKTARGNAKGRFTSGEQPDMSPGIRGPAENTGGEVGLENEMGRLLVGEGKSRYVSNTFWASMAEEVRITIVISYLNWDANIARLRTSERCSMRKR